MGGKLLGWRTVCAVEIDAYCRRVLLARQRDGILPPFPIWDDVRTFDGHSWRGHVDVITGGFPCNDISIAGNRVGISGERSSLWGEMARIIGEVRPSFVLVENSPILTSRGLGVVLGDLAALGYDARWGVLGARHVGAPHRRDRIWIVANSRSIDSLVKQIPNQRCRSSFVSTRDGTEEWWQVEPKVGLVANEVADRVDRNRALGNGQVPEVVRLAWEILKP